MKRLKTFRTYILLIIGFYFFSNILIFIGLNNTYDNISYRGIIPDEIAISSAKATLVNGKINGIVQNDISYRYAKFNFYTELDTLKGSYYLDLSKLENNSFEFYFKLHDVENYSVELTNEEPKENQSDDFALEPFSNTVILALYLMVMFM